MTQLTAKAGQLGATWEQYQTAAHASSNLTAPNECALADGIGDGDRFACGLRLVAFLAAGRRIAVAAEMSGQI
jgi:hypothetical protein